MSKHFKTGEFAFILLSLLNFFPSITRQDASDENDYSKCDLPYLGSNDAKEVPSELVRMGPNSKYFLLQSDEKMPIRKVAEYCEKLGLQPAEIRHHLELIAVESFLKAIKLVDTEVSLGINDDKLEGQFKEYSGADMKYHAFAEGEPDNKNNMESCVALFIHHGFKRLVYKDVACDRKVTVMCMFKVDDKCFKGNPLTRAYIPGGFSYVGSSPVRDYFVGLRQRTRSTAASECAKRGYKLVDFSTGLANNQILYEMLKQWINTESLYARSAFWTGGKIEEDSMTSSVPTYRFGSSGKLLKDLSDWPSLTWDKGEPSDASGIGLDQCVSAILYEKYSAGGDNNFTLSTTNCRIPLYPLCYKEKVSQPIEVEVEDNNETSSPNETESSVAPEKYCPLDNIELDLDAPGFTDKEIWELALLVRLNALDSDSFRFKYSEERPWLSSFVEVVLKLARKAMSTDLVPRSFTNIIHNLIILYYNAVNQKIVEPSESIIAKIKKETSFLQKCMDGVSPYNFKTYGGLPRKYKEKEMSIFREDIENIYNTDHLDIIVDSLWFSFQTAVALCYPQAAVSKTTWLYEIHHFFVKYFLNPLQDRWIQPPEKSMRDDYGVFMGNLEVNAVYLSVRMTSIAAFMDSAIEELYFARPIYLLSGNKLKNTLNRRETKQPD